MLGRCIDTNCSCGWAFPASLLLNWSGCVARSAEIFNKGLVLAGQAHSTTAQWGMTAQSTGCVTSSSMLLAHIKARSNYEGRQNRQLSNHSEKGKVTEAHNTSLLFFLVIIISQLAQAINQRYYWEVRKLISKTSGNPPGHPIMAQRVPTLSFFG